MITLLKYFRNYKLRLFFTVIIKIIGTLCELAVPFILSHVLNNVIPKIEGHNIKPIINWGVVMVLFALAFLILNITANRMASKTTTLIIKEERGKLYKSIMDLRLTDLDEITLPSLVSRISSDTYNLNQALNQLQRLGIRSPFIFLGGLLVCSILSVRLTIVFYVISPIVTIIIYIISRFGIKLFTKMQNKTDTLIGCVRENITGARIIKALAKEDDERERYSKLNKEVLSLELASGYTMAGLNPIVNYILDLGLTLSILYGAYQIRDNTLEVGTIIAFISYFTIISNAMVSISRIFNVVSKGYASAIRIKYVEDIKPCKEIIKANDTDSFIKFDNVSFSYNRNGEYAIKNISFDLKKNETLGIIGSTGSGKSTILNLLLGFYDYYEGEIYIMGKNIKSLTLGQITKAFSSVLQSDILFNDTIRENIKFNSEMSDSELIAITKDTDAYGFISSYKDSFDHIISPKGNDLSGGQKQRLLISRALAKKSPILILDDSSSALDYKTDSYIRKNLKKYNLTSIVVAQRVSSIMSSDKILVIDDGMCLGYGTHDELKNSCDAYKLIYNIQMGDDYNG